MKIDITGSDENADWIKLANPNASREELEIHEQLAKKYNKKKPIVVTKGGKGSGHEGHEGRKGKVGGSMPGKTQGYKAGDPDYLAKRRAKYRAWKAEQAKKKAEEEARKAEASKPKVKLSRSEAASQKRQAEIADLKKQELELADKLAQFRKDNNLPYAGYIGDYPQEVQDKYWEMRHQQSALRNRLGTLEIREQRYEREKKKVAEITEERKNAPHTRSEAHAALVENGFDEQTASLLMYSVEKSGIGYEATEKIHFNSKDYDFKVAGTTYSTGGSYSPDSNMIELYPNTFTQPDSWLKGCLAHEYTHLKFNSVIRNPTDYLTNKKNKDAGKRLMNELRGVFKGRNITPGPFEFLVDVSRAGSNVSSYAASYWKQFFDNKSWYNFTRAVNETFAEMSKTVTLNNVMTDMGLDFRSYPDGSQWLKDMYEEMNRIMTEDLK